MIASYVRSLFRWKSWSEFGVPSSIPQKNRCLRVVVSALILFSSFLSGYGSHVPSDDYVSNVSRISLNAPESAGIYMDRFVGVSVAYAEPAATGDGAKKTAEGKDDSTAGLGFVNGFFNILFALITPLLMLAGWLLTPDWVFGEIFGLRVVLHDLWILVSNLVYVIFAFLLVAMAFANIFWAEGNTWAIKAKLPKLIVGIISVPFTWFFVSAIVSIASLLTASAIQLAGDLKPTGGSEMTFKMPKECTINFKASATGAGGASGTAASGGSGEKPAKFLECKEYEEKKLSEFLASKSGPYGIVSYYAYGVFKIDQYKAITGTKIPSIKSILDLSVQLIIALVVFLVFFLTIIALVFALFMRALYFWAIAVFSPILSLRYFFEGKLGWFGDKWLSIPSIIGLAMVPVYVAAALSFWLIFMSAVMNDNIGKMKDSEYVKVCPEGSSCTNGSQTLEIFGMKVKVEGEPVGSTQLSNGKTIAGWFIGQLVIQIAAICILWFAVMAALKWSDVTKEAAAPIESFGAEIWKLGKKLPQYAPIIPTGHGAASISSLPQISATIWRAVDAKYGSSRGTQIGDSIAKSLGFANDLSDKVSKASRHIDGSDLSTPWARDAALRWIAEKAWMTSKDLATQQWRETLNRLIDRMPSDLPHRDELKKAANDIKNDGDVTAFMKKYNEIAGKRDETFDEVKEWNEAAKKANWAQTDGNNNPRQQQTNNTININVASGDSRNISVALEWEGVNKKLTGDSETRLKWLVKDIKDKNDGDVEKDKLRDLSKQLGDYLETQGITDAEAQNKIKKAIGLDIPPPPGTPPAGTANR